MSFKLPLRDSQLAKLADLQVWACTCAGQPSTIVQGAALQLLQHNLKT